ncbi:MAG: hypothetical protein GXP18_01195 [Gammaproteobacteria bacterium]|nr:hypothetical protein [Gammaproteobacteria bacterium]
MLKISKTNYLWIRNKLEDDEVIVWVGKFSSSYKKPIFSIKNLWHFLFITIFLMFFLPAGFAIFLAALFLILFKSTQKTNSIYIITNARAISLNNTEKIEFISYYPDQIKNFKWRKNADGSGDIIFKTEFRQEKFWRTTAIKEFGFMNITNVKRVMDLLERLSKSNYQYNWSA